MTRARFSATLVGAVLLVVLQVQRAGLQQSANTFTVSGTIVNADGERLRPARAVVRREGETGVSATTWSSTKDGRFTILNLAPGRYRLFLEALPFETMQGRPLRHFARVTIRPATGVTGLSVVAAPGVTLSGELVFPRESTPPPLHNVWVVAAEPEGRTSTHEMVRADRTFALADVFGIVRIGLSSPPDGFILRAVRLGDEDITGRLVEIEPDETRPLRLDLAPAR